MFDRSPLIALAVVAFANFAALGLLSAGCDPTAAAAPPPTSAAAGANPLAAAEPTDARLTGRVVEALRAGGYTYLRLDGPVARWAVVSGAAPAVGEHLRARVFAQAPQFHSSRLGRTFAELRFVRLDDAP